MTATHARHRICAKPDCNQVGLGRHCAEHSVQLGAVYNRKWRQHVRPLVLARDRGCCHYCGHPAKPNEPLDAAHLDQTQALLRQGRDVHDITRIVAAHPATRTEPPPTPPATEQATWRLHPKHVSQTA